MCPINLGATKGENINMRYLMNCTALAWALLLMGCDPIQEAVKIRLDKHGSGDQKSGDSEESESEDEVAGEEEGTEEESGEEANSTAITYVDNVESILAASCLGAGCHSDPDAASGIPLDSYANAKIYIDAALTAIVDLRMPSGGKTISDDDIAILQKWKEDGLLETKPVDGGTQEPPQPPALTYAAVVQPMMAVSCLGAMCHSQPKPKGMVALDTKQGVVDNFAAVIASITGGRMPKGAKPSISATQLEQLKQWEALGFPD
jgi:hypothetical protein